MSAPPLGPPPDPNDPRFLEWLSALWHVIRTPIAIDTFNIENYGASSGGSAAVNTAAISNAITAAAAVGGCVFIPANTYNITSITLDTDGACIVGMHPYDSVLQGTVAANDIVVIGNGTTARTKIRLSSFRITSSVAKTSGAALHLNGVGRAIIDSVVIDGQDGTGNLYDGVWFDKVDAVSFVNFGEVYARNNAVMLNGAVTGPKAGLFLANGKILTNATGTHNQYGVLMGGAFGGLNIENVDIIGNKVGLRVDQSLTAEVNRELFIGANVSIDSNTVAGIQLVDGMNNGYIQIKGWNASNVIGIDIQNTVNNVNLLLDGGTLYNNSTAGIKNASTTANIRVLGTSIRSNGVGLNNTVANTTFIAKSPLFISNTTDTSGNIFESNQINSSWSYDTTNVVRQMYRPTGNIAGTNTSGGNVIVLGMGDNGTLTEAAPPWNGSAIVGPAAIILRGFSESSQYRGSIEFWTKTANTAAQALLIGHNGAISALSTFSVGGVITSTVSTGTAPLTIASTTTVSNLVSEYGTKLVDGAPATHTYTVTGGQIAGSVNAPTLSNLPAGTAPSGNGWLELVIDSTHFWIPIWAK